MKSAIISSTFFLTLVSARPVNLLQAIVKREVPQEHSHNLQLSQVRDALNLNNPDGIQDPVFGLLGNAVGRTNDVASIDRGTDFHRLLQQVLERLQILTAFSRLPPTRPSPIPKLPLMSRV